MAGDDLGLVFTDAELQAILSGQGTPPSIAAALRAGSSLKRVKGDAIWSSLRFAANVAAAGTTPLAAKTYGFFSTAVNGTGMGFTPSLTLAQTNLGQAGKSPFSGPFLARSVNMYFFSTTGDAENNEVAPCLDLLLNSSYLVMKKGTSFQWQIGPLRKVANFRGGRFFSMRTNALGYGFGDGYKLAVPFFIAPDETISADLVVPDPAAHGLILPNNYVVDAILEFDGDAVELVSQ